MYTTLNRYCILLFALCILSLSACSNGDENPSSSRNEASGTSAGNNEEETDSSEDEDSTPDTSPDLFSFIDQTETPLDTSVESNTITITGIDHPTNISINGGEYRIDNQSYTQTAGTINNGQQITIRQTSSEQYATQTDASLTIGDRSDTFSVTTLEAPAIIEPSIELSSPLGGETLSSKTNIAWGNSSSSTESIEIRLSTNSGQDFDTLIAENAPNTGEYQWDTFSVEDGATFRIRLTPKNAQGGSGDASESNSDFSIVNTQVGCDDCDIFQKGTGPVPTQITGFAEDSNGNWYASVLYNWINWAIIKSTNAGADWEIIDQYQRYPGESAFPSDLVVDNQNRIYSCGRSQGNLEISTQPAWTIRVSNNLGTDFATRDLLDVDQYSYCEGLTLSPDGNTVYAFGQYRSMDNNNLTTFGIVRASSDGGDTWQTLYDSSDGNAVVDLQIAPNNDLYLLNQQWQLVRSSDNGSNWQMGGQYSFGQQRTAGNLAIASNGSIYVAGYARESGDKFSWHLTKTTDFGNNWELVHNYLHPNYDEANTSKILLDTSDELYLAGSVGDSGSERIVILHSDDDGANWNTVVDYQSRPDTYNDFIRNIGLDKNGKVMIVGTGNAQDGLLIDENNGWQIHHYQVDLPNRSTATSGAVVANNTFLVAGNRYDSDSDTHEWLVRITEDAGNSWELIDQFSNGNKNLRPQQVMVDQAGYFYVGGYSDDNAGNAWVLRRSINNGASWDHVAPCASGDRTGFTDMVIADDGKLYLLGYYTNGSGANSEQHAFICLSENNGADWNVFSDYLLEPGSNSASAIKTYNGNVYLFGSHQQFPIEEWYMLSSSNGTTWERSIIIQDDTAEISFAIWRYNFLFDPMGNLFFSSAQRRQQTQKYEWLTLQSSNFGGDWAQSDLYLSPIDKTDSYAEAMTQNSSGDIYVLGSNYHTVTYVQHTQIRRTLDHGSSWQRAYYWQPYDGSWMRPYTYQLLLDDLGNALLIGSIQAHNYQQYWFSKKIVFEN